MLYARKGNFHAIFLCELIFSTQSRYPTNTAILHDGNFNSHLKPMKDTYRPSFRLTLVE